MKVLVTGAAGFIGSHTCEELVRRGHDVVGVDSFDDYLYPAEPKRVNAATITARLDAKKFQLIEANICDEQRMHAIIGDGIEAVCHLAALAGVRPSLERPLAYVRTNLHGTTAILEACRAHGVMRVAAASSSSVYGSKAVPGQDLEQVQAFREDDPCLTPASPYAATKRAGELISSTYRDLFGIGASCLRFFTVYGPRQRPDMAIHKFAAAISAGKPITLFGDGSTRRDYTFISDIVAGTVAAVERVEPGSYTIYNLGGTHTTSLAELVALVEETVGKRAIIERLPLQPGDVPITFADITNSSRDLDYAPTTGLSEGIGAFWDWYQTRD
jgi:UDP-glucuronate 4-epimerase